jgi:hypothetical protein
VIPSTPNPWGLTQRESDAVSALVKHRDIPAAGKAIGVSYSQVTSLIASAKRRMNVKGIIALVLEWDRWARGDDSELDVGTRLVLTDSVVDLIASGVATDPDAMVPFCRPYTRQQVMVAVRNAAQKGRIHLIGRVSLNGVPGQRLGIYAVGPSPQNATIFARQSAAPVSSVWELGARA